MLAKSNVKNLVIIIITSLILSSILVFGGVFTTKQLPIRIYTNAESTTYETVLEYDSQYHLWQLNYDNNYGTITNADISIDYIGYQSGDFWYGFFYGGFINSFTFEIGDNCSWITDKCTISFYDTSNVELKSLSFTRTNNIWYNDIQEVGYEGSVYTFSGSGGGNSFGHLLNLNKIYASTSYYKTAIATIDVSSLVKLNEQTVTFNSNGGSSCNSISVLSGNTYGTLPTPTRDKYIFGGWYKNSDFTGNPVTDSDIITESHTLYAKWNLITYEVTINASTGGMVSYTGGTITINDTITSFAAPNAGKTFLYWLRASDNAKITDNPLNQIVTANETYTAVFGASVEGISVTSTKGGTAYIVGDDFDSLADTDTITFATKPCLSGYAFSHWEDMNGNNLGTEMSIRLQKSVIIDNIITAVYVENNANINNTTNN